MQIYPQVLPRTRPPLLSGGALRAIVERGNCSSSFAQCSKMILTLLRMETSLQSLGWADGVCTIYILERKKYVFNCFEFF